MKNKKYIIKVIMSVFVFFLSYCFINILSTSIILSIITFNLFKIIETIKKENNKQKLINEFPSFIILLKNKYTSTNSIIVAMQNMESLEYFYPYINKFNIYIKNSVEIEKAFDILIKEINIKRIGDFLINLKICSNNGGDMQEFLERALNIQIKENLQNEQLKNDIWNHKLVLICLIILNIYILFGFSFSNEKKFFLLTSTLIGKIIINLNILSYLFMFNIYMKLNKVEE